MGQLIKLSPSEYIRLTVMMTKEQDECQGTCKEPTDFKPNHFSGWAYRKNGEHFFYNNSCESHGRHYNPETKEFEGRDHCTCDTCF